MRGMRHTGNQMSDVEQTSKIAEVVRNEPWRRGSGQPLGALDPTWNIQRSIPCDGVISYEAGSNWWHCTKCGYCGNHGYQGVHRPINSPLTYLIASINGYLLAREKEGIPHETALEQMYHVAGVALRYAAATKSEDLGSYVQKLVL